MQPVSIHFQSFLLTHVRQITIILLLFIAANATIYSFSPQGSYISADTKGYIEPAIILLEEGNYSSRHRLPGYPFFIATIMYFTDAIGPSVVVIQGIMLFVLAIVAAFLTERVRSGSGVLALILICFSPSTLFYTQKILPDILFALLFILYIYFLMQMYRSVSIYSAIAVGIAAGLATLVRGNGQYLIFLIPIIFLLGYRITHARAPAFRQISIMLAGVAVAVATIAPWLYFNANERNEYSLVTEDYRNYAIHDNIIAAVSMGKGISKDQAITAVYSTCMKLENITTEEWSLFDNQDKRRIVANNISHIMQNLSIREISSAVGISLVKFFLISEGRGWSTLVQLENRDFQITQTAGDHRFSLSAVMQRDPSVSVATTLSHLIPMMYYAVIYVLFLAGFIYLVRMKSWDVIIAVSICIALFAGTAGFIGQARYRLPVEPLIIVFASIGMRGIMNLLGNLNKRNPAEK
jgi:4-amino-4-deoxy-L-arabinose transferase-like glycosyltransferase